MVLVLFTYAIFKKSYIESRLGQGSGFFSMLFFMFNHALYANANNMNFRIDSSDWLFKMNKGWEDYFLPYEINSNAQLFHIVKSHPTVLADYPISDYKRIIPHIYRYNHSTIDFINAKKAEFGLIDGEYDSIFIRRGDKITTGESRYLNAANYIDLLVVKSPSVKLVYVQTDDFAAIEELREHISKQKLHIELRTLCKETQRGTIVFTKLLQIDTNDAKGGSEVEYINRVKKTMLKSKTVEQMNSEEVYEHALTMIAGIDLVCKSRICICDYESNVGRFIKLFHRESNNVYDVLNPDKDIDYNKLVCPGSFNAFGLQG